MSKTTTTTSTTSNHCGNICTSNHSHHHHHTVGHIDNSIKNNISQYCNNSLEFKLHSKGSKVVSITIVGARDLRKREGGKIDPYVEVRYKDKTLSTKTLKNTNNPIWDETFEIEIKENDKLIKPKPKIILYVWDREMFFKNNDIGYATLSLETIVQETVFENWLEVLNGSGSTGIVGQLHVRAEFITPDDIDYSMDEWLVLDGALTKGGSDNDSNSANSSANSSSKSSPSSSYNESNINQILDSQRRLLSNLNNNNNNNNTKSNITTTTTSTTTSTSSSSSCKSSGQISNVNRNSNSNIASPTLTFQQQQQQQFQFYNGLNGSIDPEVLRMILLSQEAEEEESNRDLDMLSHCIICKKFEMHAENLFLMDDCLHNFCRSCLKEGVLEQLNDGGDLDQISCLYKGCNEKIQHLMVKSVLGKVEYEQFLNKQLEQVLYNNDNFIHCPNCQEVFERIEQPPLSPPLISSSVNTTATTSASTSPLPQSLSNSLSNSSFTSITSILSTCSNSTTNSNTSATKKRLKLNLLSPDGITVMSEESARHREEYRFRCTKCSTEFCSDCKTSPYHYAFTCDTYSFYLNSRKCRFCLSSIKTTTASGVKQRDICTNQECEDKLAHCCEKVLSCGHQCIGVKDEEKCEPCIDVACVKKGDFNNEEYCNICYVESIKSAPSVKLDCGHIFHYGCLEKRLTSNTGPRLTFHHIDCPMCKKQMKPHAALNHLLEPILKNKAIIQSKSMERLAYEGLAKCKEIEDRKSKWYQDPENYSMDRYVYYNCFKCKSPYFAGQARCDEGMEGGYKDEDLICGSCKGGDGKECKLHGWDYIIWKCQFCCSVAQWYCWNKVHFCTDCHTKQQKGDYLNKKPKSAIPECEGIDKCPLKVEHPHVAEFALGCFQCRHLNGF